MIRSNKLATIGTIEIGLSWSSTSGNATREARINDAKVR